MGNFNLFINKLPRELSLREVKNKNNLILQADADFYREDKSSRGFMSWGLSIFFFLMAIFMYSIGAKGTATLIITVIILIPSVFLLIYGFIAPKKELVLDRMNGLITVTRFMWKKSLTFPFNEGVAKEVYYSANEGIMDSQLNLYHNGDKKKFGKIADYYLEETWSFMVWYMDKNRPLPPGSAFDPYRQKDFERRKAEGFPPPLYKSSRPTPEKTAEQQKEREKFWKG